MDLNRKDMVAGEAHMHKHFAAYNLGGELFDKVHMDTYTNALKCMQD